MQEITQDIIKKASEGDLQAFELVYKVSSSFVYNVAYRVLGNREDAQEITQEVFLILHRKLKDFRFESSFKTWVYRVTTNCAINLAKKESRTSDRTVPYEDYMEQDPAVAAEVDKDLDREYNEKMVSQLLAALNPDQRACIVLWNL